MSGCGQKSILNKQGTIIGQPKCNGDCPESYGCADIIQASCISKTPITSCIPDADTLQQYLENMASVICTIQSPSGSHLVSVDSSDLCPDYLINKVQSNCLNIYTEQGVRCKKLHIDVNKLTWTNITTSLTNITPAFQGWQRLQYATDCNGEIHLRGSWFVEDMSDNTPVTIATLPVGIRPLYTRVYANMFNVDGDELCFSGWTTIESNGAIKCRVRTTNTSASTFYWTFDGLSFETN